VSMDRTTVSLEPADSVPAGGWGSWTFVISAPQGGIPVGSSLEILFNSSYTTNTWSPPQTYDPTMAGFVSAEGPDGCRLGIEIRRLTNTPDGTHRELSLGYHVILVTIEKGPIPAGQSLSIHYGDKRGGGPGAQAGLIARRVQFPVTVKTDPNDDREFQWSSDSETFSRLADSLPEIRIIGGPPTFFNIVVPSDVALNEKSIARIAVLDRYWNAATGYKGAARIFLVNPAGEERLLGETTVQSGQASEFRLPAIRENGFYKLVVLDVTAGLSGQSNPFRVGPKRDLGRYWGEIHCHTLLSDGVGTLDEHYQYAQQAAVGFCRNRRS